MAIDPNKVKFAESAATSFKALYEDLSKLNANTDETAGAIIHH
jgi:hypothetical protein